MENRDNSKPEKHQWSPVEIAMHSHHTPEAIVENARARLGNMNGNRFFLFSHEMATILKTGKCVELNGYEKSTIREGAFFYRLEVLYDDLVFVHESALSWWQKPKPQHISRNENHEDVQKI